MRRLLLVLVLVASTLAQPANDAAQTLHQLFDTEWEYQMAHNPVRASLLGDRRWNDKWPDVSLAAMHQDFQHGREVLDNLHRVDRAQLSAEDQLNYDVFDYNESDYVQ